jgi:hypothetical protein
VVLKVTGRSLPTFAYGTITRYGWPFQYHSASKQICNSFGSLQRPGRALQPPPRNDCSLIHEAGLGFSPFARHYSGNDLSSWGY